MKKYYLLLCLLYLILLGSCSKDLGNYDYVEIDSLLINNIPSEIDVQLGQSAQLTPTLSTKFNSISEDDLSYEWVAFDKSAASSDLQRKLLSNNKNLDTIVPLAVGSYPSYFTVKQKSTGRSWNTSFTLNIVGQFGKYGWFVLYDKADKAHLDFYQDNPDEWNTYPVHYSDFNKLLYDENTSLPLEFIGKSSSLANYSNRDIVFKSSKYYLYVNTSEKTYKVNMSDGYTVNSVLYNFVNETVAGIPSHADKIIPASSDVANVITNGDLYSYYYIYNLYYNLPLNRTSGGASYKISNYVAAPMINSSMNLLIFDETNRRFMKTTRTSSTASTISTAGQAFNAAHVDKDLVWMGHTNAFNQQAIALFKDGTEYYLARMDFNSSGTFKANSLENMTTKLTDIANATLFAIDQQYGYLFYVSGDRLYQYDMDAKTIKNAYTFSGRKASMLKVERLVTLSYGSFSYNNRLARMEPVACSLILATYDENNPDNSGKVEFLRVQPLMGELQEAFGPFIGLGKVVDVNYVDRT